MLTGFVLVYSEGIKLVSIIRFIFFSKCKTKLLLKENILAGMGAFMFCSKCGKELKKDDRFV